MRTKRWQAGLAMLVAAVGLLANAMPAEGGQIAQWYEYPGTVGDPGGGLAALDDGKTLALQAGQHVVVALPVPLTSSSWPDPDILIHMSGQNSSVAVALTNDSYVWVGFDGSFNNWFGDWVYTQSDFDFSVKTAQDTFNSVPMDSTIKYVKIYNGSGVVQIDGVEELSAGPVAMIQALIAEVEAINGDRGICNSLDAKLQSAVDALQDANANNDVSAVNKLQAFINEVQAQCGKNIITANEASKLITQAQVIIDVLLAGA